MTQMTLNEAMAYYYEKKVRALRPATQRGYRLHLETWRTWIAKEVQPNPFLVDIGEMTMVRYFNRLRPPALQESTFNLYRQYLKGFWGFCQLKGWIILNPMQDIDPLRPRKRPRLKLSPDECDLLLDATVQEAPRDVIGARDRIVLAVALATGLRAGDVLRLRVGAINLGDFTLSTEIEKSGVADSKPLTSELYEELLRWYKIYAKATGRASIAEIPDDWWLAPPFHRAGGNAGMLRINPTRRTPLSHGEVIVQRYLAAIGRETRFEGMHTLRRTSGLLVLTAAKADGQKDPLGTVQDHFNHASRATTELYVGMSQNRLARDELLRGRPLIGAAAAAHAATAAKMNHRNTGTGEDYLRRANYA